MPPRRSARVAAVAERQSSAFALLPHALVLYVFSLLPVDQRMRCAEVCRGWHTVLSDTSLWLRLDLPATGLAARPPDALLRAAAKRAAGGLQALDVSQCERMMHAAICAVAAENAGALVELRVGHSNPPRVVYDVLRAAELEQLLRAAPRLRVLDAVARCDSVEEARRLLRSEAPFELLRVRKLIMLGLRDADAVRSLTAELPSHTWLTGLRLYGAPLHLPGALDTVVDAALQLRLTCVEFYECRLGPASVPALARVLGGNVLRTLGVRDVQTELDEPAALLLGNALRANTALTSASFTFINLFNDPASAAALLGALTAHPSLRKLDVSYNSADGFAAPVIAAAGAALAALVAANAPALHELNILGCGLGDAGMGPLVDALPHNTHLQTLHCRETGMSEAFCRDRLLPAVSANAWLQVDV